MNKLSLLHTIFKCAEKLFSLYSDLSTESPPAKIAVNLIQITSFPYPSAPILQVTSVIIFKIKWTYNKNVNTSMKTESIEVVM